MIEPKPRVKRSPKWRALSKRFLKGKKCSVCGGKTQLVAHHIVPVHIDATLELIESNLIPMCEGKVMNCHCVVGHLRLWVSYNPTVRKDAVTISQRITNRPGKLK